MAHFVFVDAFEATFWTVLRALELGHMVTLIIPKDVRFFSKSSDTIAAMEASNVVDLPTVSDVNLLHNTLDRIHNSKYIDAVVNQVDETIEVTASACAILGLNSTGLKGVAAARHKYNARRILDWAGLESIRHAHCSTVEQAVSFANTVGFPLVIKPVSGCGSLLAQIIDEPKELERYARYALASLAGLPASLQTLAARGIVVEEFVVGDIVSVEVVCTRNDCSVIIINGLAVSVDNPCIGLGTIVPAPISKREQAACGAFAIATCRTLGLDVGVFHVELILTSQGPVLLEVNPRMMGGVMTKAYSYAVGTSFHDYVLASYLGGALPQCRKASRTIVTRKIISRHENTIPTEFIRPVQIGVSGVVDIVDYNAVSGRSVKNTDMIARVLVARENYSAAFSTAESVRLLYQTHLGFDLQEPIPFGLRTGNVSNAL